MGARIFLGLFGLPFFGVGVWALISIAATLADWNNMKSWEPVQARILSGGTTTNSGDDSDTYKAYGEYVYSYHGQEYKSSRVAIESGSDNIGDFQETLGRRIAAAQGSAIEAYVNPANPGDAVINRDIRWAMIGFKSIFLIVFGGVGLGLLILALKAPKEADLTQPLYQESPWLVNENWRANEVRSSTKFIMYFAWGFTILWNAISAPMPFMFYEEVIKKHNYPAALGMLFPLVGIGLLVWAIRQTVRWKKFGDTAVVLDPFPGSIGGQVGGTIELAQPYDPAVPFTLTLSCIYTYTSGSGKNRSRSESVKWQDTAVAYTEMGVRGTRIIFRFDVPEGLPPPDTFKGSSYHLWRLNLAAPIPGVDVDIDYEIPVYPTRQKSSHLPQSAVQTSERATLEMDTREARSRTIIRPGAMGMEMFYPMGRNIGSACTGMLCGAIFSGAGGFMVFHEKMYIFGGLFALIGAPIFLGCLYMCVNSLVIRKNSAGDIETVRCIFGLPVKKCRIPMDDMRSLAKKSSFSTQSGNKHVKHYTIYTALPDGKNIVLGEDFHGEGEADAGITLIRETFGIKA